MHGKAANSVQLFLAECGEATSFEEMTAQDLDKILKTFYFDAQTVTSSMYKASSMENFRHSLNRYLKQPPHNRHDIHIIKDDSFRETNEAYKAAVKELRVFRSIYLVTCLDIADQEVWDKIVYLMAACVWYGIYQPSVLVFP